jgi:hypothetical protein
MALIAPIPVAYAMTAEVEVVNVVGIDSRDKSGAVHAKLQLCGKIIPKAVWIIQGNPIFVAAERPRRAAKIAMNSVLDDRVG